LDDEAVTFSFAAGKSLSPTVTGSVGFVGSPSAAGRPVRAAVTVGTVPAGFPPPEPIAVPGANATPRKASFADARARTDAAPERSPPMPLVSVIPYRVPAVPSSPLLVA
jgi:hypothetical protein